MERKTIIEVSRIVKKGKDLINVLDDKDDKIYRPIKKFIWFIDKIAGLLQKVMRQDYPEWWKE